MLRTVTAVVTGAASGLGRATAMRFARQGALVGVLDRPGSDVGAVVAEIGEDKAVPIEADVSSSDHVARAFSTFEERFGIPSAVVHCAGIAELAEITDDDAEGCWDRIMSVNATGTFNMMRRAVLRMGEREPDADGQRGVIINTSSIAACEMGPKGLAYAASKGAVLSMTLPAAREFADKGIRVCAIAPGIFDTNMVSSALSEDELAGFVGLVPFPKRMGDPDEFAAFCEAIVTNHYFNGDVLRIDAALHI